MEQIQEEIEKDRKMLESQIDMAEKEKKKIADDLAKKEAKLHAAQLAFCFPLSHGHSFNYELLRNMIMITIICACMFKMGKY